MSERTPPEDAPATDTGGGDDLLAELTDDFLRRHRAGERPSLDEYTSKHPDLAGRILDLFPALMAMEQGGAGVTLDGPSSVEHVGATIGRYRLLERIGEGGFGIVYMAEQLAPVRRRVAVKVIKPGYDSRQVIARFEAERQALALMDHENIAKVFDAGATDSGRPYFVMELVHGVPITDYCDKNQLPPRERLELFMQVCRAVQHAHTKGIIHRDIKPTNVLVTLHEGVAVPKVIDFGVAKATGQQLTEKTLFTNFAQMVGTPLYMSPEQAEMTGVDVDTRSDVYSLGVLLYELLTGTTPLDKERLKKSAFDEIRRIIREEEPPRPSTRLSTLGDQARTISARRKSDPKHLGQFIKGEVDWIVMKALEKDRQRRYETANGLARDIERYLQDEPVEACPPSKGYRLRKFVRRNKGPVLVVAVVLIALAAGVIGTAAGLVRAKQAQRAERQAKQNAEAREAETKAVLDFMQEKVMAAARPEGFGGLGHDVLLRQAIEAALPFVEKSFTDQPLIEARLRMTLGTSFTVLGQPEIAAAQFTRARSLFTKQVGDDDSRTLNSMYELASSYRELGRYSEAAKLGKEVLALRKVKLGRDHVDTLNSMDQVANTYDDLDRPSEALKLHEESLALHRATLGADHENTLLAMYNLASCYARLDRSREELKLQEELVSLAKAKLGPEHYVTLLATKRLASCYGNNGQTQEALRLCMEMLSLMKRKFGPGHPDTILAMNSTAIWLDACGRRREAIDLIDESVRLAYENGTGAYVQVDRALWLRQRYFHEIKDANGCRASAEMAEKFKRTKPDELYTAATFRAVAAGVFRASGTSPDATKSAVAEADRAMEWLTKAVAAGYSSIAYIKNDRDLDALREREDFKKLLADLEVTRPPVERAWQLLTDADASGGDPIKAVSLAQDAVASTPNDARCWDVLGVARYRAGDARGAISAFEKHRELLKGEMTPTTLFFLAMAQCQVGEREKAKQSYDRAIGSIGKNPPNDPMMIAAHAQATELLNEKVVILSLSAAELDEWNQRARVLRQENKLEQAHEVRAKVVETAKRIYPKGDLRLAKYQCDYVELLIQMKSYDDAAAAAHEALASLPGKETALRSKCLGYLVEVYTQLKKPQEEARYREILSLLQPATQPSTGPANVLAQLPTTRPSVDALDIQAFSLPRHPVGSVLTVWGRVGEITSTRAHNAMNIEFAADPKVLMVWVPSDIYAKLVKPFGAYPAEALNGLTICVRGRVEKYGGYRTDWKDRMQLTVQDAQQVWLMANEPSSPTTAP